MEGSNEIDGEIGLVVTGRTRRVPHAKDPEPGGQLGMRGDRH